MPHSKLPRHARFDSRFAIVLPSDMKFEMFKTAARRNISVNALAREALTTALGQAA